MAEPVPTRADPDDASHLSERILELRRVPMFRALPMPALVDIARAVSIETCAPSAALTHAGKPVIDVSWVLEGHASFTRDERPLGAAGPGSAVGLLPALAHADAPCEVRAVTKMRIARLPIDRMFELLEDSFDLLHATFRAIALDGRRAEVEGAGPSRALPRDIDFTERLVRLRMTAPFAHAPIRPLARLAQRIEARRWPRGARLWERGARARSALVILSGALREADAVFRAGETVGLTAALAGAPHGADAYAIEPLIAMELDAEMLVDVLEDEHDLALELLRASALDRITISNEDDLPPDLIAI